jgi:hypothetical protein
MGFWSKVKSAFKKVAAVALVVVAIVAPELIPAIGNSILTTLGVSAPSVAASTAAGSSAITTAGSLAAGNSPAVAFKQGAVAGVSSFVGISTATSTGSAAVGSAAGSAAGTAVAGGNMNDIIKNAVTGGMGAGVGDATGSAALGKGAATLVATGGNIKDAINSAVTTELTTLASQGAAPYIASAKDTLKDFVSPTTTTPEQQAAAGAQDLVDASKAQPGTQLAQADTSTTSDVAGTLGLVTSSDKKYDPAAPGNVLPYTATDITKPSVSVPGQQPSGVIEVKAKSEAPTAGDVLPFTSTDIAKTSPTSTTGQPTSDTQPVAQQPSDPTTPPKVIDPKKYYTGVTPAPSPLAQGLNTAFSGLPTTGLTAERGAGEIESKESGKDRQNVWNEASLRLKDALGV